MNAAGFTPTRAQGTCFALAFWVAGASAVANIIHAVPAQPVPYGRLQVNVQDIDINGDGVPDLRILSDVRWDGLYRTNMTQTRLAPLANTQLVALPAPSAAPGFMMAALDPGTLISPSPGQGFLWYGTNTDQSGSALVLACTNLNCCGAFPFLYDWEGYAGVRFVVAGTVHYGWIRFWNHWGFGDVTDWAYESQADTPIRAGDTGQPMPVTRRSVGSIVLVTPNQPISYAPVGDGTFLHLDLDGDGLTGYTLHFDIQRADIRPLRSNSLLVTRTYDDFGPNTGVALLNGGYVVGPNAVSPQDPLQWFDRQLDIYGYAVLGAQVVFPSYPPNAASSGDSSGVDGYVGLRFESSGTARYGWLHVSTYPNSAAGRILSWAYEIRPNTSISTGAGEDSDGDGVWDYLDQCPTTPAGAVVDANGCSIEQLCPCDGPWKNHGEYVSRVQAVAARFVGEGLITRAQAHSILKRAAASDCGKPNTRSNDRR